MAGVVVVCAECGAKNKPREFCVRCGAALQAAPSPPVAEAGPAVEGDGRSILRSLGGGVLGLCLVAGAWFWLRPASQAQKVSPALFTLGERDASPPAAPPGARPALAGSVHDRIRALLAQGDAAGAAALAREALSESADDGELFYLYAQALWDGGDRTGAIARLRDAARLVPARRLDLAKALEASGDLPEAIQQYQQLVQDRPDDRDAQHRLGSALLSAKRYADAVAPLRAAAGPEDPVALQDLGWALEKSGDSNGALETYRSILEGVPGAHLTRSRMSEVLFNAGRGQEALELVRGGLALEDSAPLLHRTLGSLLERSGQPEAAAQEYRTFLKLSPNSSEAADIRSRAERLESRSASR